MKLSVIMPVYNEQKTIREIIKRVMNVPLEKELIIVDDGSKDDTRTILKEYENQPNIRVYYHEVNKGKAGAIKTGIQHIEGQIVIIQDGDLETDPNDYIHLTEPIRKGEAQVVYGSRNLNNPYNHKYFMYYFGAKFLSTIVNVLYGQNISDEATCYKVFRTEILKAIPLQYDRFEFCPEVTAKVSKMGYKIKELPMHYYPRSFEDGKKMNWRDGLKALWVLVKFRFVK